MEFRDRERISRRTLLCRACVAPIVAAAAPRFSRAPAVIADRPNDIRILEVRHQFEDFQYRAPYQFGGRSVDRVTLLNVTCRVRTNGGRESSGFGSMTLGNAWAFPAVAHDVSLGAMRALADALQPITAACVERGHPVDLFRALEPEYLSAAAKVSPSGAFNTATRSWLPSEALRKRNSTRRSTLK